jgi:hypothetical protein
MTLAHVHVLQLLPDEDLLIWQQFFDAPLARVGVGHIPTWGKATVWPQHRHHDVTCPVFFRAAVAPF